MCAGENCCARRCADRIGHITAVESHSFSSQPVNIGRVVDSGAILNVHISHQIQVLYIVKALLRRNHKSSQSWSRFHYGIGARVAHNSQRKKRLTQLMALEAWSSAMMKTIFGRPDADAMLGTVLEETEPAWQDCSQRYSSCGRICILPKLGRTLRRVYSQNKGSHIEGLARARPLTRHHAGSTVPDEECYRLPTRDRDTTTHLISTQARYSCQFEFGVY